MRHLRTPVLVFLLLVPIALLLGAGTWALWETNLLFWVWWLMPACWGLAFLLAKWWRTRLLPLPGFSPRARLHWSPRDDEAARIVVARQQAVGAIDSEKLTDPHFYLQSALDLSLAIARHYHPKAKDPLSSLTVPEILAAAHLAFEDLEHWVQTYVPASHLLTVRHWRALSNAPSWYDTISNVTWAVSVLINPLNLGRYITSRLALDPVSKQVQANVLAAFYVMFLREVGYYCIEMNSGRLLAGADQYREMLRKFHEESADPESDASDTADVTIAVVGQVKAGKSSLINALLGERRAETDVLPKTREVTRYQLHLPGRGSRLALLDTAGYAEDGATRAQRQETREACRNADLILLVMNVRSPAREPDRLLLNDLTRWFAAQPRLKPPPVLGVLTNIDGLSPVLEWEPPYNWDTPTTLKEEQIRDAVEHVRQEFGERLDGVIPVCTDVDRGRVYGVEQWLLPSMTALLGEARACALVRALHAEMDAKRLKIVLTQFRNAGTSLLRMLGEQVRP